MLTLLQSETVLSTPFFRYCSQAVSIHVILRELATEE